jgi:hypothetical protein
VIHVRPDGWFDLSTMNPERTFGITARAAQDTAVRIAELESQVLNLERQVDAQAVIIMEQQKRLNGRVLVR